MATVTVYKVKVYDIATDSHETSRRWATKGGAEIMRGSIVEGTAVEINEMELESGEQWTPIGFDPHKRSGEFQTKITG